MTTQFKKGSKIVLPVTAFIALFFILVGSSCSLVGGLTPEKVKQKVISALDDTKNYQFTKESTTSVKVKEEGKDELAYTTINKSTGKVDLVNERMYSEIEVNQADQKTNSTQYVVDGYIYQKTSGTWGKTKLVNKEDYFPLENQKALLNNSTVEILEQNPLHIKITPNKKYIGDLFLAQMMQSDPTFQEQYEINFDQAFTELDIEHWLDSEYRITRTVSKMTLKLDKNVITIKTVNASKIGENDYMTMSIDSTGTSSGYNSQTEINLPDEAKNATETNQ